mmetsp:Transcript_30779/g.94329  ORF Transcript_30779/g.94329 Transcript_30779/m.94329 type:complete len:230 (+) Transcript_30779:1190-1879(+)
MYCSCPCWSPNSMMRSRMRWMACRSTGSGRTVRGSGAEVSRRYFFSTVVEVPWTVKSSSISPPAPPKSAPYAPPDEADGGPPGCSWFHRSALSSRERPELSKRDARRARLSSSAFVTTYSSWPPIPLSRGGALSHPFPALWRFALFLPPEYTSLDPKASAWLRAPRMRAFRGDRSATSSAHPGYHISLWLSFFRDARGSRSQLCAQTSTCAMRFFMLSLTAARSASVVH